MRPLSLLPSGQGVCRRRPLHGEFYRVEDSDCAVDHGCHLADTDTLWIKVGAMHSVHRYKHGAQAPRAQLPGAKDAGLKSNALSKKGLAGVPPMSGNMPDLQDSVILWVGFAIRYVKGDRDLRSPGLLSCFWL
jgi:hypothetical protein